MNQRQRLALFFILLAIILVLGLIFWQYVLNDILMPLVLTSWLFLRLFVLSIDQKYYWGALFFASVFFLFRHLIPNAIPESNINIPSIRMIILHFSFRDAAKCGIHLTEPTTGTG